jgi:hypothetical protein
MPWLQSSQHHPHNSHNKHNEVALLHLNMTIKSHSYPRVSRRFKSIYNLARDKTWQHDTCGSWRHHKWPQFTTTIEESSRAHRTLVHAFHAIPRQASMGGPHTIPCTSCRYGRVSYNSATIEVTKFAGPHKSLMCQYIINVCSSELNWRGS